MAQVKAAPKTQVAVVKAAPLPALPDEWKKELAVAAKDASATETPSIQNLSFRSGVMSLVGTPVPGNELECIAIGTAFERCLYDGPFDPNKIKNPVCFALTFDGENGSPHENSLHPQHETCKGCPMDEWGSAGEGRRGKACKEMRRIAVIPADKVESADDILGAEMAMAKIPVTSVRNWSNYVHQISATQNRPYWSVTTKMKVSPHIKNQFEVTFDMGDTIDDGTALQALKQKRALVEPFVMAPYSMATEEPEPPPKAPPKAITKKKF
jgi:hypothetical protein